MDAATQSSWNAWLADYVGRALEHERNDVLTPAIGQALSEVRKEYDKKLTQVREEVGALRAELTMQAGIARGEIAELKGSVPKDVA